MTDDFAAQMAILDAQDARKAVESVLGQGAVVDLKNPNFYFHCPCDVCAVHPTPHPTGTLAGCKFAVLR